jgi:hypothetical protein
MRVVKGKVVGNTVVLEEVLPEGSVVDVVLRGEADGWDLSADRWAEIDASIAEADAGQLIPADVVLAQLSNILK